jgi:hypothetical protein
VGGWLTISCSRTQVKSWGMKMALRPAPRAGLMSERGLLPIIQVEQASQPWWVARVR